ncbi:MAG: DUF2232 domain-containing protein [Gammaproteobacteria bacterium]
MRALARFVLSGPMQAVAVVYGFSLLSLYFPFLVILSGAALALITLQLGLLQSVKVMLISTALFAASAYFLLGSVSIGPLYAWLSVMMIAAVYRSAQSMNLTMQLLAVFGLFLVILAAIIFPDMQKYWREFLQNAVNVIEQDPVFESFRQSATFSPERLEKLLSVMASVMTGILVSLFVLTTSITLFLARQWQGFQENIRSFREEFIALRLGKILAVLAISLLMMALMLKYAIFWQLALVCLSIFSIQGMSIVHAFFGQFSNSIIGLVMVYGVLFVAAPQMLMTLSTLGVVDTFFNFRKRFVKT